ncbi:MAG: thioredoxin domain-containing protein [Candidatus Pacebacteria bacterium]|jgi:protein-disulfide isomerase|nr:thioredoxin domain-containing protein [Candidatus Paceibacterota bacterium]MDD3919418.1 thioredoxin domain-containing protein [Candidatus Paceibacterota bacterium]
MHKLKLINKQFLTGLIVGAVTMILIGSITYLSVNKLSWLSTKIIEKNSAEFINAKLLQGQGSATVKVIGKENDLYKLEVDYNGQKINSYISKDGKKLYPQVYSLSEVATENTSSNSPSIAVEEKSDKPTVELFVMSYCPYGTQIEKGILPAVKALGDKIDFKLKFVSYTMHGEKENQENLRQYCIDKVQPAEFYSYLDCFLISGDANACLKSAGVDDNKTNSCMDEAANQFDITGTNFNVHKADNDKYGVQGSPTLVINGTTIQSGRDSASLLKTICSAFNNAPSECQDQLSTEAPAPGFGKGTNQSGASGSGSCN